MLLNTERVYRNNESRNSWVFKNNAQVRFEYHGRGLMVKMKKTFIRMDGILY